MPNRAMACTSSPVVMVSVEMRQAPDRQQGDGAQAGQRVEAGLERGPQPAHPQPGRAEVVGRLLEAGDLPVLQPQRLHHQRALERLVGDRGDVAQPGLGERGRAPRPAGCRRG